MKRLFIKICIGLISLLMIVAAMPFSASADETGTVVLRLSECQVPIPDLSTDINIYRIADYEDGPLSLSDKFEKADIDLDELSEASAIEMTEIAKDIEKYIEEEKLEADKVQSAYVGRNSTVSGLDKGIYIFLIDDVSSVRYICTFTPIICQFPSFDDSGEPYYDLEIVPKYSLGDYTLTVTSTYTVTTVTTSATVNLADGSTTTTTATVTATTTPPSSGDTTTTSTTTTATVASSTTLSSVTTVIPDTDRLPQTGTMLWIVYILGGLGIIFLITLWGMCRKDGSGKGSKLSMLIISVLCIAGAGAMGAQPYIAESRSVPVMSMAVSELKGLRVTPEREDASEHIAEEEYPSPEAAVPEDDYDFDSEEPYVQQDDNTDTASEEVTYTYTYTINEISYIGVLEVPSLGLELPVASDCSLSTLRTAPGCYSGSAAGKNLVIGAHNYRSHFGPVRYLDAGEEIIFTDVTGIQYNYTVTEVVEVDPDSSFEVCNSGHDLALFTCNSSGSRRIVIYCDLAE